MNHQASRAVGQVFGEEGPVRPGSSRESSLLPFIFTRTPLLRVPEAKSAVDADLSKVACDAAASARVRPVCFESTVLHVRAGRHLRRAFTNLKRLRCTAMQSALDVKAALTWEMSFATAPVRFSNSEKGRKCTYEAEGRSFRTLWPLEPPREEPPEALQCLRP